MTLDPKAVEAAARLDYEGIEDALTAYEQRVGDGRWSESGMRAAITAYIAHIEPKLRERVIAYNDATWDCVVAQERGMAQAEVAKRYEAFQDAGTALYALLGLEAE